MRSLKRCAWLSLSMAFVTSFQFNANAVAAGEVKGEAAAAGGKSEPVTPSMALTAACDAFKSQPSDVTWADFMRAAKELLAEGYKEKTDPAAVIKTNPPFNDLGAKVIDAGGARIWTFPKIAQCQTVLIQYQQAKPAPEPRRRSAYAKPQAPKVQELYVPTTVTVKEARLIDIKGPPAPAQPPTAAKKPAVPASESENALTKARKPVSGRYLFFGGREKSGVAWLKSYKVGPEGIKENLEPLSLIPPFLFSNLAGKVAFSGNDLVMIVRPTAPVGPQSDNGNGHEPEISTYKLAFRLVDGRYALEGKAVEDTPYNSVYQFAQSLVQGRVDLAKAWLMDARLISIPRYIGLSTRNSAQPLRIINMSGTPSGVYRFRLVTFEKNDLVVDVARTKTLWAIKAIFIAPSDPILQKIARSLPSLDKGPDGGSGEAEPAKPPSAPETGKLPGAAAKPATKSR